MVLEERAPGLGGRLALSGHVARDGALGNLDPELSAEIMRQFIEFNRVGVTVLIASHDLELISRLGHRKIVLDAGRVIHSDPRDSMAIKNREGESDVWS